MKNKSKTRISEGLNLGPKSETELNSIGIDTVEQMKEMGWEEVCLQYIFAFPKRLNFNMVSAIIGAIYNKDWRRIDPKLKNEAVDFVRTLRKK